MEKVKSITPADRGYKAHNKQIDIFYIEFESGLKGEFKQQEGTTKFVVGQEYDVVSSTEKRNSSDKTYTLIDKAQKTPMKPFDKNKFISYYDRPEVQARITAAKSLELAIETARILKSEQGGLEKMRMVYLNWILKEGEDSQTQLSRRTALELAIKTMSVESEGIIDGKAIINRAEKYYTLIK